MSRIEHFQTLGRSLAAHGLVVEWGGNLGARGGERNVPGFGNRDAEPASKGLDGQR